MSCFAVALGALLLTAPTAAGGSYQLITAVIENKMEEVKRLLDEGADVNTHNVRGLTLLSCATLYGNLDIAEMLLKRGADREERDGDGHTPLGHAALIRGQYHTEAARMLVTHGADINSPNEFLWTTPLGLAARNGNLDVAVMLLERGATVDAVNVDGDTPLAIAAKFGFVELATVLIERGANVNATVGGSVTPLALAALHGHHTIAHELNRAGAINWVL